MPSLDLIVVHHADEGSTRACVADELAQLERLRGIEPAGIVVVDNGPTGEVGDLAGDCVRVIAAPRRQGFGANVTLGASASDADLVLMLNDDARIAAGSIEELTRALELPATGAAGPAVHDASGGRVPSAWRFPGIGGVAAFARRQDGPPWVQSVGDATRRVDVLSGVALMVRRRLFLEELGGFDPGFFMFSEDADLCRRLADRGLDRLFVPVASATHTGQGSTRGHERERDVEQWRSRSRYWRKHHPAIERGAIRSLYGLAYLAGAAAAFLRRDGVRARRLLFLSRCALRTPRGPGLAELASGWRPATGERGRA